MGQRLSTLGDSFGGVRAEVGLVEDHLGPRAARPDPGEVALDPADVEVRVQAADGEDDVDIGRDDLGASRASGGSAGEHRAPFEDLFDDGGAIRAGRTLKDDPIPDGGESLLLEAGAKLPREPGAAGPRFGPDHVRAAVLGGYPSRDAGGALHAGELLFEKRAEAQGWQMVHDHVLHDARFSTRAWSTHAVTQRRVARHAGLGSTVEEMRGCAGGQRLLRTGSLTQDPYGERWRTSTLLRDRFAANYRREDNPCR
jgi:hypothetical protein